MYPFKTASQSGPFKTASPFCVVWTFAHFRKSTNRKRIPCNLLIKLLLSQEAPAWSSRRFCISSSILLETPNRMELGNYPLLKLVLSQEAPVRCSSRFCFPLSILPETPTGAELVSYPLLKLISSQEALTRRNKTCHGSAQELLVTTTALIRDSCPTPSLLEVSRNIDEEIKNLRLLHAGASCNNNRFKRE